MYIPKEFRITDTAEILNFIQNHPFGILIQSGDAEPIGTHLPFLFNEKDGQIIAEGHIALANPQSTHIRAGKTAMIVLTGADGYISSSVYTHQNVPTWNYQSVHVYGTLERMNEIELTEHLDQIVHKFEDSRMEKLKLASLPGDMLEEYKREIVGFRLTSYRVEAAFKLSQNRNEEDHQNILEDLGKCPINAELIEAMKKHR
jgi:transcriptional regulator